MVNQTEGQSQYYFAKQADAWGGKSMMNTPYESRMVSASASRENSRPGSPDRDSGNSFVKRQNEKIRGLASAILQIAQMMDIKYFKSFRIDVFNLLQRQF